MNFSLRDRVALVTGSSTGLGKGIAFRMASAGAKVAINYMHNHQRAEETLAEFNQLGYEGMLIRGDVSTKEGVDQIYESVRSTLGPIDVLVVNATPSQPQKPIEEYTWESFEAMIDFFIKSPYLLARAVLPVMKENKWGRIINITSEVFQRSVGNFSAYVSAKGGQIGFTRSMATELAPDGITINAVAPGWIQTDRHANDPQERKDGYRALIPADRWGTPEDVAGAVHYFASDEASFITGQTLCVNGGMTPW